MNPRSASQGTLGGECVGSEVSGEGKIDLRIVCAVTECHSLGDSDAWQLGVNQQLVETWAAS